MYERAVGKRTVLPMFLPFLPPSLYVHTACLHGSCPPVSMAVAQEERLCGVRARAAGREARFRKVAHVRYPFEEMNIRANATPHFCCAATAACGSVEIISQRGYAGRVACARQMSRAVLRQLNAVRHAASDNIVRRRAAELQKSSSVRQPETATRGEAAHLVEEASFVLPPGMRSACCVSAVSRPALQRAFAPNAELFVQAGHAAAHSVERSVVSVRQRDMPDER